MDVFVVIVSSSKYAFILNSAALHIIRWISG